MRNKEISLYELYQKFEAIFRIVSIITIAGLLMQMICACICLQTAAEKETAEQKAESMSQYIENIEET